MTTTDNSYLQSEAFYEKLFAALEEEFQIKKTDVLGRLQGLKDSLRALTGIERQKLALAREAMNKIGIPQVAVARFVAEKNYEIAKSTLLLSAASASAEMSSRPDMYYQARQFQANVSRLLGDTSQPYREAQGSPQQQNLGTAMQSIGQGGGGGSQTLEQSVTGGGQAAQAASASSDTVGGTKATDPAKLQLSALQNILKASPPSQTFGLSESDVATLNLLGAKYKAGMQTLNPGTLESMDTNDIGIMKSAGTFLGYDPGRQFRDYVKTRPGQGNALGA